MGSFLKTVAALSFFLAATAQASVNPSQKYQDYLAREAFKHKLLKKSPPPLLARLQAQTASAADTHVVFETPQAALDWAESVSGFFSQALGAEFKVLPLTDPRYAPLQATVHDIWGAYTELFPEYTEGLNEPPVILVESDAVNAFVSQNILDEGKISHAVVILTGILDAEKDHKFMSGVLGHEIGHSVFRHAIPEFQDLVSKFYRADLSRLGYKAERDNEIGSMIDIWQQSALFAGDITNGELRDLPTIGMSRALLLELWTHAIREYAENPESCVSFKNAFVTWIEFQKFDGLTKSFVVDDADLPQISLASDAVIAENRNCAIQKVGFIKLLSEVVGVAESDLQGDLQLQAIAAEFDAAPSVAEGIQLIVKPFRETMVQIQDEVEFENIGYFNAEEHADDVSLIIHRHLGWDPDALTNFFEFLMPEDLIAQCKSIIDSGVLPPSGSFSGTHRADCYRMNHLNDMNSEIGSDVPSFAKTYIELTL